MNGTPPIVNIDSIEILKKRLNYREVSCDFLVAGPRKEQNTFLISLLSEDEKIDAHMYLDIGEKRLELITLRAKIEQALGLENSMEIV